MAKIQISIDDELLNRIDTYADECYISRSGLISLGMTQYLNSNEVMLLMRNLGRTIQKIADDGSVDEKTMQEIEDFEKLCKLVTKQ